MIHDRRRIDPETGQVRPSAPGAPAGVPSADPETARVDENLIDELRTELGEREREIAERTEDLQRLQAQFVNYRRRVERDATLAGQQALASVVVDLLPVLDDIDRARVHGDLQGAFKAVAESVEAVVSRVGAEAFCEPGDPFDPAIHEAVTHGLSADVAEPVCAAVMRRGYRMGDRLLRAAMVAVVEPGEPDLVAEPEAPDTDAT